MLTSFSRKDEVYIESIGGRLICMMDWAAVIYELLTEGGKYLCGG